MRRYRILLFILAFPFIAIGALHLLADISALSLGASALALLGCVFSPFVLLHLASWNIAVVERLVPVEYRNLPGTTAGTSNGLWIELDPEHTSPWFKDHELDHCARTWRLGFFGKFLVKLSKKGRIWWEATAYACGVRKGGRPIESAARAMSSHRYDFTVSYDRALREIGKHLP